MKPNEQIILGLTAMLCGVAITAVWPPSILTVPPFFILLICGAYNVGAGFRRLR